MFSLTRSLLVKPNKKAYLNEQPARKLWEYLNVIFNRQDVKRRKEFGPDRTCAEWVLRNGGAVRFVGAKEYLRDYNLLPAEGTTLHIKSVDATDSAIMHHGFDHFVGCKHLDEIILNKCNYIYDKALAELAPLSATLFHLQVTECHNVTDDGLLHITSLLSLSTLKLGHLSGVKDLKTVVEKLKGELPKCTINTV